MKGNINQDLKEYRFECKKCSAILRLQGNEDALDKWLDKTTFMCPGRHVELGTPRDYLELVDIVDIDKPYSWEPKSDRKYINIHEIEGLEHMGFGMFKDPRTREMYDYETDENEGRHYYII